MANEAFKQLTVEEVSESQLYLLLLLPFCTLLLSSSLNCRRCSAHYGQTQLSLSASLSLFTSHHPLYCLPPSLLPLSFRRILGPKLIFVSGLVIFVTAVARLVCPDLLGKCLSCSASIYFGPSNLRMQGLSGPFHLCV